ncbi:MAG TPA: AAA family ATPase [Chloroflexota bacterium]|nr:AAA family ATPase [Chloroflexota bacterium]
MSDPLIEAIGKCDPEEPLSPGDPRWQNFDPVRGSNLHKRISRRLRSAESAHKHSHIALSGHRGCGKSTELNRIMDQARQDGYLPLYCVVNEMADPNEVGFGDVFMLMLRLLDDAFREDPHLKPLPDKTVKVVTDWFREVTHVEEKELERAISYSGEVSLGPETPLAKILFGLNVLRKSTGKQREEIKRAVEKYPYQLRQNLNLLLDDARQQAQKAYPRGFLFILDNLDRYPPEMIDEAVLKQGELYNGVFAHIIFVVPISLLYKPPGETVEDRFEPETMPMITVYPRGQAEQTNVVACDALAEAIYKRVDANLFATPLLAREIARLSGGCPRDLLRLVKEALLESDGQVNGYAVQRAASIVRAEMARKLNQTHYAALAKVFLDGTIDADETGNFLLFRRAALEYNGDRWVGVHPLLWESPEFKKALAAEKEARGLSLGA